MMPRVAEARLKTKPVNQQMLNHTTSVEGENGIVEGCAASSASDIALASTGLPVAARLERAAESRSMAVVDWLIGGACNS